MIAAAEADVRSLQASPRAAGAVPSVGGAVCGGAVPSVGAPGGRGRRGLRTVLAVRGLVAVRALGLFLPALREVLHEGVQRLLLALGGERLLDRLLGLGERLLAGLGDRGDGEDVVAVLGLDRTRELVLLGGEDGVVELLVERALGLRGQLAAGGLRRVVDRVLLGDGLPGVAGLERGLGLVGGGLVLGQDDAQVTLLGLREAGLVLVVEVLDRLVGDLVLALDDLVADLVRQQVELDALEDVLLGLAGGRAGTSCSPRPSGSSACVCSSKDFLTSASVTLMSIVDASP